MKADRIWVVFGIVMMSFLGAYSLFVAGEDTTAAVGFSGVLFLAYVLIAMHKRTRVREANFYQDWFEVKGKNMERKLRYMDIDRVSKNRLYRLFVTESEGVSIWMRGEDAPIVLHGNAKNRKLKTDLYSWLVQKTRNPFG